MKTIKIGNKEISVLNHEEKAAELGISLRQMHRYIVSGKISSTKVVRLPGSTKTWYLPESKKI